MLIDEQGAKLGRPFVSRRRQGELVADALGQFVRPCRTASSSARSAALRAMGRRRRDLRAPALPASAADRHHATAPDRGSACGRRRRRNEPAPAASRRYSSPVPAARNRRPAPPRRRRMNRPACGQDPKGCWSCRKSRCSSTRRRARAARWVMPSSTAPAALSRCTGRHRCRSANPDNSDSPRSSAGPRS